MNNKFISKDARGMGFLYSIMIMGFVLLSYLSQAVLSLIFNKASTAYSIINQCVSSGVILLVVLLAKFGGAYQMPKFNKKGALIGVPLAILLFLGMFMGLGFINNLIAGWLQSAGLVVQGTSINLSTPWHFICFVIALAILPALSEEIFFRGVLLKGLNKIKPVYAVLLVSLVFGLYHMSLSKFVYQFIFGASLCVLYMATESLLSCIVAHFINNFTVLLSMFVKVYVDLNSPVIIAVGLVLFAAFIAIVTLLLIKKKKSSQVQNETYLESKTETGKFLAFAGFGMLISALLIVLSLFPV